MSRLLAAVFLLACVPGSFAEDNKPDYHTSDDQSRDLYIHSAFAHGVRHGYEEGYHAADMDIHTGTPRKKDDQDCLDPNPISAEPLSFLLPAQRGKYTFTWVGRGKGKEQNTLIMDFREIGSGKPEVKERDDAFVIAQPFRRSRSFAEIETGWVASPSACRVR